MCKTIAEAGKRRLFVRLSTLALISLTSCARADSPELFTADPRLQNDFNASLPTSGSSLGFNYAIVQGVAVLEGDILLGNVDAEGNLQDRFQARGVGQKSFFSRWPDGKIIYQAPTITENSLTQVQRIAEAIEHWTDNSRLEFIERTSENADQYNNYIVFTDSGGCGSFVGMIGGEQEIFLSDNCSVGSVIHEIGHAIGLFHEHTRPDRDSFVAVDFDAIIDGRENNFFLLDEDFVDTFGDYDYGSIMHYGTHFFSNSPDRPTIIVADSTAPAIGQRLALSEIDIFSSNAMYATDLQLGTPITELRGDTLEVDVDVFNTGDLGANNVEMAMQAGEGVVWQVATGSAWECATFNDGDELNCALDSLIEGTQANLLVSVQLNNSNRDDLSIRVASQTLDLLPGNNTFNGDDVEWSSFSYELDDDTPSLGAASGTQPDTETETETETTTGTSPAEETGSGSGSEPQIASAESSAGGGGSVNLSLLLLLSGLTTARSWTKRRKTTVAYKS